MAIKYEFYRGETPSFVGAVYITDHVDGWCSMIERAYDGGDADAETASELACVMLTMDEHCDVDFTGRGKDVLEAFFRRVEAPDEVIAGYIGQIIELMERSDCVSVARTW